MEVSLCVQPGSLASDLLGAPLIAQGAKLVRVRGADLMQRSQVPRQVRPEVLFDFRKFRDILRAPLMIVVKRSQQSLRTSCAIFDLHQSANHFLMNLFVYRMQKALTLSKIAHQVMTNAKDTEFIL